jgi:DNA repair protein RecO (recombination protein O)
MARTYKTEAIVLRSLRYGEADRILHLYTRQRGRVGAIAKGIRKTKSRVGARLEPLSHAEVMLHEGSGELQTVTGVDLVSAHRSAREQPYRLNVGLIGAEAMLKLYVEPEPNAKAFAALARFLDALDETPAPASGTPAPASGTPAPASRGPAPASSGPAPASSGPAPASDTPAPPAGASARPALDPLALSFQLKLLWLSGYLPHVTACVECGAGSGLVGFSARAGGAVCRAHATGSFPLSPQGLAGIERLLSTPLADAAGAGLADRARREALSVVTACYEEHGGFRLRTLSA